jgi:hypothetical protein
MITKVLCITLLAFTALIFWGNHYATRSDAQTKDNCNDCKCLMAVGIPVASRPDLYVDNGRLRTQKELDELLKPKYPKKESCSVVFRKKGGEMVTENLVVGVDDITRFSCGVSVFCGRRSNAAVICGRNNFNVQTNTKCSMYCLPGGVTASSCEIWNKLRPPRTGPTQPNPEKSGIVPITKPPWSMLFASTEKINPLLWVNYDESPQDDEGAKEIISGSARWRLIDGEGGFDKGTFTVTAGVAEVRSFCTGDTIRLTGPNVLTLPNCAVDISGRWQGAYTRRLPLETGPPVAIILDLRNESGALKGELKTPDGMFNITSARQNSTNFQLEAEGTIAGNPRKIVLSGKITKGDIVFDGTESGMVEKPLRLLGAVRRMYIADSSLLPAVLNQPYNFKLTAVSPDTNAITFRLAGGTLPRGISFDASSGRLIGTPTETGTFKIRVVSNDPDGNVFEQPFTLDVKKMIIATRLLPDAFIGQPYSATLMVAGGQPPYRFSGNVGKGLTLDPSTGQISGTPTSSRSEGSWLTIYDSKNNSETQPVLLHLRTTTILTSHFLPEATQGTPYRTHFKGVGNNIATQWRMDGENELKLFSLLGLTLNPATGEVSGTPTRSGEFLFSIGAVTTSSDQQYRNFSLIIKPGGK